MKNWDYFDKFSETIDKYMPAQGEGDTMASQAVTAVNKLIYKWYNDGDVFDNTHHLEGWANDLSSYANWLARYVDGAAAILDDIELTYDDSDYEDLLGYLAEWILGDEELLDDLNSKKAEGSIYNCEGDYKWEEPDDDETY